MSDRNPKERLALLLTGLILGCAIPLVVLALGRSSAPAVAPGQEIVADAPAEAADAADAEAAALVDRLSELGYDVQATPAPATRNPVPEPAAVEPRQAPVYEPAESRPVPVYEPAPESRPAPAYEPEPVQPRPAPTYEPPAPTTVRAVVPAGRVMEVELAEPLSSKTAVPGQEFSLRLSESLYLPEGVSIPAGSSLVGRVVEVERGRRPQKPGRLLLTVDSLEAYGDWYGAQASLSADGAEIKGRGSHEEDAQRIGIGAAAGTILGAILKGKEGAIAGLVLGGGGVFLATRGEDVELPAGMPLAARLEHDLVLELPAR